MPLTKATDVDLQVLHQFATQFLGGRLPDYVTKDSLRKEAQVALPPSAYGDPGTSSLPTDTRDATFLSQLFFRGSIANGEPWNGSIPETAVADRLDKAATFWNITADVDALKQAIKVATTTAELTPKDYALSEMFGSQPVRRFPVISGPAVKVSCARFFQDRSKYPYAWRLKAAQRLLEKAAEFHVTSEIPEPQLDYLMKACSFVPSPDRDVAVQLMYRAQIVGNPEQRKALEKLARAVNAGSVTRPRSELCSLVDQVDRRATQLFTKYASGLPLPEEICFTTGVQKEASLQIQLGSGSVYDLSDLGKVGIEPYAAVSTKLAQELAADDRGALDLEKAADILPTLPRDQAVILDRAFEAVGVKPKDAIEAMQVKAAANMGNMNAFNLDEWYKFAKDNGHGVHENFRICVQLNHPQRTIPTSADSGKQGLVEQHTV